MYLKYYVKDGIEHSNDEQSLKRKLSSLKSFYNYYYRNELITQNPAAIVKMPKLHEKNIVRLDVDEVAILLDEVEADKTTAGISRKDKGSGLGNLNFNAWYRYSCFRMCRTGYG